MIGFRRRGKNVQLATFSSRDVAEYLDDEINEDCNNRRFEILARSKMNGSILATIDGESFIIYGTGQTSFEISCNIKDAPNMADVINALKGWNRFSKTERKFMVEINCKDDRTRTIIFENGYISPEQYEIHFSEHKPSITEF